MNGQCRQRLSASGIALLALMLCAQTVSAADPLPSAGSAGSKDWSWTGFYMGGHVGALSGTSTFSNSDGPDIFGGTVTTPGFVAGAQAGYDWLVAPQWVVGLQADASYVSSQGSNTCLQSSPTIVGSTCTATPQMLATLTSRLGYVTEPQGRTMIYGKGGLAWMQTALSTKPNNAFLNLNPNLPVDGTPFQGGTTQTTSGAWGWTLGAGVEHALTSGWSLSAEYNYLHFSGVGMPTSDTADVTESGHVTDIPGGTANITQELHVVKLGLNYRWGVRSSLSESDQSTGEVAAAAAPAPSSWTAGWEVEGGTRFWYSWGKFQSANGPTEGLLSRLTYDNMIGQSGEFFARIDSPANIFVKGLVGGGFISQGKMNDEDWGLSTGVPSSYEVTESSVTGTFNYITADIGYNVMHAADHKVGLFVGYNRYQYNISMFGCAQLTSPGSGVCSPPFAPDVNGITEVDTWHSLRVGTSIETRLWDRFKITGDFAYLPYVYLDALDIHRARQPPVYFPSQGIGNGVQVELMLSYQATEKLRFGLGGRYWAMWTNNATQGNNPDDHIAIETERYGLLVEAAYKFY